MALYSIVIPVYNAEKSLDILYQRIREVFENTIRQPFEIVFVDDCSKDSSFAVIRKLVDSDRRVRGIQLSVNHGQQKAVLCGFHHVNGDYVITMDDDLQHPPEQIPVLIQKMNESEDIDVVIGAYETKQHGPIRRFGSSLMNWSNNIIYGKPTELKMTSFRIMKRYVVDNLNRITVSQPTVGPLLLQTNGHIVNVTVEHDKRTFGKSGYNMKKLIAAFFRNVISNSDLPLTWIGYIGLFSFLMSLVLVVFYVIQYFTRGIPIAGWTTIIVILLMFGGMTLFSIGIIGRYLISIMIESKKNPGYLIRTEYSHSDDKNGKEVEGK